MNIRTTIQIPPMQLTKQEVEFYSSLKVGQVIHVDYGFRQFIRCKVTQVNGSNRLQPIALVGKWGAKHLPHFSPDGELKMGYAGMIETGDTITPHLVFVYESKGYAYHDKDEEDPHTLEPLKICAPAMTKTQQEDVVFYRAINHVREILREAPDNTSAETPDKTNRQTNSRTGQAVNRQRTDPRILLQEVQRVIEETLATKARGKSKGNRT